MRGKLITNQAPKTNQLTTIPRGALQRKLLVWKYGDFQATVAKSLDITSAAVNRVWQRHSNTPRIVVALLAELNARIADREVGKDRAA